MSKKKYRVVVIGTGMIANAAHIPAWKALKNDVEVIAVADVRPEAARETAARYAIPQAYADPQKMLDELKPDIVSVCTPNVYHKEWTLAGLKAGAHVLCEKPLAVTHADALEMFRVADEAGRVLYPSQSLRWFSAFTAGKNVAESGALGDVYYAEISCIRRRGIPKWGFFHMKEHNAGGPLCDLGVHMIDSLYWIIGNPRIKSASGGAYLQLGNMDEGLVTSLADSGAPVGVFTPRPYDYHEFNVEDFASGFVRLEGGITVLIRASWAVNMPESFYMSIAGTRGGLHLPPLTLYNNQGKYQSEITMKVPADPDIPFYGHYGLTENMIQFLNGEADRVVKPQETLNVIQTIEALYKSAETGKEVVIG